MDSVADTLVAIKNASMAKKEEISLPYSKFKFAIAKILEKEKFVKKVEKKDKEMKVALLYGANRPKITQIQKISKQGLRVYTKSKKIKKIKGGKGIVIISTPLGVMTGKEARRKKLGGEVICQVW